MVKTKTELLTVTGQLHIWLPVQFGSGRPFSLGVVAIYLLMQKAF